jgi:hypothetical protein
VSTPVENLVQRLHARRSGKGWMATCPAHDDRNPSLSINEGSDGRALMKCHAGCDNATILAALGMEPRDLFPAHRQSGNGAAPIQPFDWQQCVSALKAEHLVRLGNEHWYARDYCSRLHEKKLIGLQITTQTLFKVQNALMRRSIRDLVDKEREINIAASALHKRQRGLVNSIKSAGARRDRVRKTRERGPVCQQGVGGAPRAQQSAGRAASSPGDDVRAAGKRWP